MSSNPKIMRARIDGICNVVARHYQVPMSIIDATDNHRDYIKIRQHTRYLLYSFLNSKGKYFKGIFHKDGSVRSLTLQNIADVTGLQNHDAVLYSVKIVDSLQETDQRYKAVVTELVNEIFKECDFGHRKTMLTVKDDPRGVMIEVMCDRIGKRYYRIKAKEGIMVIDESEMDAMLRLRDQIGKETNETWWHGKY
jgi:hypothetical protein